MVHPFGNDRFRFGSAAFVGRDELARTGMFRQTPSSVFVGFFEGRPLWYDGDGGLLTVAGARSGKLRDILAYNICSGICSSETMLILDMKGELAAISRDQTPDHKHCIYWNPFGLHGLPQHRINPTALLKRSSPTLFSDMQAFIEQFMPRSGSANAAYFELNARRYAEAIGLALVLRDGALSLPALYKAISAIPEDGEAWLDIAWEMYRSGIDLCRTVEADIAAAREDSSGGFRGIVGELQKAVACLSDPLVQSSLSPPYDFDLAGLCDPGQRVQFYKICPPEMIETWSPVIKASFTSAMLLKSRSPQAPRQTWILDECAQLKGFELVEKMFSYGAGIGIRPWAILQDPRQMRALSPNAEQVIPASAALQGYFGLRDIEVCRRVSEMLGSETLSFADPLRQSRADLAFRRALQSVFGGADPFQAAFEIEQQEFERRHLTKQHRKIRLPAELLTMVPDRQIIFTDGISGPIYAERAPYWQQTWMAGRYHPNPYHPPLDRVLAQTRWGPRWFSVITGPVPEEFAHYPQYQSGHWSTIGR